MSKIRGQGQVPVGYKNNRLAKTMEVDPETFPIIRKAWDMFLSGLYSIQTIKEEIPIKLALSRWYVLFDSIFYTGQFPYKSEVYQRSYPPIITIDEYERGQDLLGKKMVKKSSKHQFAYSHLFKCDNCRSALVGDKKKKVLASGKILYYTYYSCAGGIKGYCDRKSIREVRLTEKAETSLSEVTLDADFWQLANKINLRHAEENVSVSNRVQDLQVSVLKDLKSERLEFARLRARGKITEEIFDAEDARLAGEIKAVSKNMQNSNEALEQEWKAVNDVFEFSATMLQSFKEGDDQVKNWILRKFGTHHRFKEGNVYIEPNELMVAVRTYFQSEEYQKEKCELQKIGSRIDEVTDPQSVVPGWCL